MERHCNLSDIINSIKKELRKSCKELNIEKQFIVYDFKLTVDEIKSKIQNQSLFSQKTLKNNFFKWNIFLVNLKIF